jgi:ATP phosphoribosyltransferase regulatory subunit
MGLRADTTAQISRIASTRLAGQERPLRLCYAADVLRVNGSQLRPERQFVQAGCELIGDPSPRADAEVALLSVQALHSLGVRAITIDLAVPSLAETVFAAYNAKEEEREALRKALVMRDFDAIDPLKSPLHQCLSRLLMSAGPAQEGISSLLDAEMPQDARAMILTLQSVYNDLRDALNAFGLTEVSVTVDPVEFKGHEYHKGVSFTLFSLGQRGELGSGGRYSTASESATGFTLYMDTVLRAYQGQGEAVFTSVSAQEPWARIFELQRQGHNVVRKG